MRIEVLEKRDIRRVRPRNMACSLGQVIDLSPSGMGLLSDKQLKGTHSVILTGHDKKPIRLHVRVVWHRRCGEGEHLHGLRFERVTVTQREQLQELLHTIAYGQSAPIRARLREYGLSGLIMVVAAISLLTVWLGWTQFNALIDAAMPGIYQGLSAVPELDALLLILAGGCTLMAVTQRFADHKSRKNTQAFFAAAAQGRIELPGDDGMDSIRRSQSVLNCILESSLGGVCVLETIRDKHNVTQGLQIQLINPAGEQLIGKRESELVGETVEDALPNLVGHELYRDLQKLAEGGDPVQKEYQIGEDGRWFLIAMVPLDDGIAITFLDNTEAQLQREQLQHIAYHDELTGLPNRKALIEHVDSAIGRARRSPGHRSAVLFLDFDRFKHVNDTLGHEAGDQLLINIAERLRDNLRETDTFSLGVSEHLPARLGGDEFVVLLDGMSKAQDAITVAKRLLNVFNQPHTIAGQEVVSTASIGVAVNEGGYDSAEDILRDADSAMYAAKQTGKARYVLFDQDMHNQIIQRLAMEKDLRHAVSRGELALVYEPIIDLQTGQTAGFEALVRWHHPEHGVIMPDKFIPLAEELNLIGEIGAWVFQEGCSQMARWKQAGSGDLLLNLNLSRGQLYEPNFVQLMREAMEHDNLDPGLIQLELTETMVMNDLEFMATKLGEIKSLGVRLALDDFGSGYSSLAVLHRLPFDTLKIDRAFLDDARTDKPYDQTRRSSAIISAITDLAGHLSLDVIAEGIHSDEQVATLQALACRYAQGWHFSKPVDADAALALIKRKEPHAACLAAQLNLSA